MHLENVYWPFNLFLFFLKQKTIVYDIMEDTHLCTFCLVIIVKWQKLANQGHTQNCGNVILNRFLKSEAKFYGGFIPCQLCTAGENGLKSCIFFCRNIRGRHPRINRWSQHFPSLCHLSFYLDIYRPPNKICEEPWLKNQFWTVHTCTWDWVQ